MNRALGLLVSSSVAAVIALALSCGNSSACGPGNCSGCCTEEGRCVGGLVDSACGISGGSCVACAAQHICQGGVCTPFSGGGGGGGAKDGGMNPADAGSNPDGGAVTPDGGSGDGGTTTPDGGTSGFDPALLGEPCTSSAECPGGICATASFGFPGGYCTTSCGLDATVCGAQGACIGYAGSSVCVKTCTAFGASGPAAGCRESYRCGRVPLETGGFGEDYACTPLCDSFGCNEGYTCDTATGFCCDGQNVCY